MPATYRKNVTDKQQGDIESVASCSAIRFAWFDGRASQTGLVKSLPAYDTVNQGNTGEARSDVVLFASHIIGNHNDKPKRFETPGKA